MVDDDTRSPGAQRADCAHGTDETAAPLHIELCATSHGPCITADIPIPRSNAGRLFLLGLGAVAAYGVFNPKAFT